MGQQTQEAKDLTAELRALRARVKELENASGDRLQSEEPRPETHDRLDQLVESLPIVLMSTEEGTTRITLASGAVKDIFGYEPDALVSDPDLYTRIIHPDDAENMAWAYKTAFESHEPFEGRNEIERVDNQLLSFCVTNLPLTL